VLTKEAHHNRHCPVKSVGAAFKRCASFVSTSYAFYEKSWFSFSHYLCLLQPLP